MPRHTLYHEFPSPLLNAVAFSAIKTAGPIDMTSGWNQVMMAIEYKHHSDISTLTITPQVNLENDDTYYGISEESVSGTVVTISPTSRTYTIDVSGLGSGTTYQLPIITIPHPGGANFQATVAGNAYNAAALMTVRYIVSVQ